MVSIDGYECEGGCMRTFFKREFSEGFDASAGVAPVSAALVVHEALHAAAGQVSKT